ncbi:MAG: hypothetical protein KAR20_06855 [Candidatus Heimdallarchaeota archaeon]|nr:hypothetical protein [Candidatus Heimdallarchaeota archaeon]
MGQEENKTADRSNDLVSGEAHKDCEGNIVEVGDFIAFQPPSGTRRYSEVQKLIKSPNSGQTHAHIHDRLYDYTILETSLLCKNR